jgi:hypothetical protein
MPDVPEETVWPGGIGAEVVDVVKRERQLDHTEKRREMPAVQAHLFEDERAHLTGEGGELVGGKFADVSGRLELIEQWHPAVNLQLPRAHQAGATIIGPTHFIT